MLCFMVRFVHVAHAVFLLQVDEKHQIKLTNISVEKVLDLDIASKDWRREIHKYIHLPPRLLLLKGKNREDLKYRARDDMYSVGIMMWEVWTGEPPLGDEALLSKSQDAGNRTDSDTDNRTAKDNKFDTKEKTDLEVMGEYLNSLQLHQSPHFENKQSITEVDWWNAMIKCKDLTKDIKAKEWIKNWGGHAGYPPLSIVDQLSGKEGSL